MQELISAGAPCWLPVLTTQELGTPFFTTVDQVLTLGPVFPFVLQVLVFSSPQNAWYSAEYETHPQYILVRLSLME